MSRIGDNLACLEHYKYYKMRILIDIGHPAHIHYFKNCVKLLTEKGYEFLFVVRERDSTIELIEALHFNYVSRGKGGKGLLSKLLMIPCIDWKLWKFARKFKPDLFLSFSSLYAAHVAWLIRKPHITFDDTEHAKFGHILCRPFSDIILSPSCYYAKLSRKQILFNAYMELCYLHPKYFTPNQAIKKILAINTGEKYCVLRLISWDANHDVGQHGLNLEDKLKLIKELEKYCKVFISSEEGLSEELKKYKLSIHPSQLHDVLSYADLYIGEGSTTASESALLGTPAIYVNSLRVGNMDDEEKYGLVYQLNSIDKILSTAIKIITSPVSKQEYKVRRYKLLNDKIDPTAFMVWFIVNYPESKKIMKENPDYQYNFK